MLAHPILVRPCVCENAEGSHSLAVPKSIVIILRRRRSIDFWLAGPYLIKTDHFSLKYLLQQKLSSQLQKKGLMKLLGLDYTIQYRKGKENKVVDALSRMYEEDSMGEEL